MLKEDELFPQPERMKHNWLCQAWQSHTPFHVINFEVGTRPTSDQWEQRSNLLMGSFQKMFCFLLWRKMVFKELLMGSNGK